MKTANQVLQEMLDVAKRRGWDGDRARLRENINRIKSIRRAPNCSGRGVKECERRLRQMARDAK